MSKRLPLIAQCVWGPSGLVDDRMVEAKTLPACKNKVPNGCRALPIRAHLQCPLYRTVSFRAGQAIPMVVEVVEDPITVRPQVSLHPVRGVATGQILQGGRPHEQLGVLAVEQQP